MKNYLDTLVHSHVDNSVAHTPGPWRANGPTGANLQSYAQPFCVAGTGEYACTLIAGCFGDTYGGEVMAEANAQLIAAAPDLLEALQGMLEWARRVKQANPGPEVMNAINTIAKALGK